MNKRLLNIIVIAVNEVNNSLMPRLASEKGSGLQQLRVIRVYTYLSSSDALFFFLLAARTYTTFCGINTCT